MTTKIEEEKILLKSGLISLRIHNNLINKTKQETLAEVEKMIDEMMFKHDEFEYGKTWNEALEELKQKLGELK